VNKIVFLGRSVKRAAHLSGRSFVNIRRDGHRGIVVAAAFMILSWGGSVRAQVKFELKYPEGKTLEFKSNSNAFQTLNLMGMEIQSSEKRTLAWTLTGGKPRGDGSRPIAFKTLLLRSDLKLQGGIELSFNSSKPETFSGDKDFAVMGDVYRLQSELAYTLILDQHGTPKAVEGLDPIREKAAKMDAISQEMLRGTIDPDRIKSQFEQDQRCLPDVAVRPNDNWERTEEIPTQGGLTLSVRKKYEYVGTEKKGDKTLERIRYKILEVKHTPDPSSKLPLKVIKSDFKVESSEGSILFERELGCPVALEDRAKIKGSLTLSGGGMDLPSELTLTLRSEKTLQSPKAK
jgi:Family of unknown function (DUF6263)